MQPCIPTRFIDPALLAGISRLDLVAKTVVDGFVAGLHRSPDFGFSQEFAEYRAYSPGDDLRHVDWNVFARTERMYLKRYRGETNSQLTLMLDSSASMGYSSHGITKLDYGRYLAVSLAYLANQQRDAAGVIIFDDDVRNYVQPSTRQGQFMRVAHAIEKAELGTRTDFAKPFIHFQQFLRRRGMVVVISDFYEQPETDHPNRRAAALSRQRTDPVSRPRSRGDPAEAQGAVAAGGHGNRTTPSKFRPSTPRKSTAPRSTRTSPLSKTKAAAAGIDYQLLPTDRPLDDAMREYFLVRKGEDVVGFLAPWFLAGAVAVGLPFWIHLLRQYRSTPHPFSSLMFFERRTQSSIKHRRLRYLLLLSLRVALLLLIALAFANPFISRAGSAAGGRKMLIIAVDNSFSMRYDDHLANAKQAALNAVSQSEPGRARAGAGGRIARAFPDPAGGRCRPAQGRHPKSIQPSDEQSSFGELARALRTISQSSQIPLEVHFVERPAEIVHAARVRRPAPGSDTKLVFHSVGDSKEPNWMVESVTAPAKIYDPKKVRVEAVIAGVNTPAAKRTVSLVLDGKVLESKTVERSRQRPRLGGIPVARFPARVSQR